MTYCYVLKGEVTGRFKVGISASMANRLSAYKTESSEKMLVLFVGYKPNREAAIAWESSVLLEHREHRIHGEWLERTAPIEMQVQAGIVGGLEPYDPILHRPAFLKARADSVRPLSENRTVRAAEEPRILSPQQVTQIRDRAINRSDASKRYYRDKRIRAAVTHAIKSDSLPDHIKNSGGRADIKMRKIRQWVCDQNPNLRKLG